MLRASFMFIACTFMAAEITAQGDFSIVRLDGIGPVRVENEPLRIEQGAPHLFQKTD